MGMFNTLIQFLPWFIGGGALSALGFFVGKTLSRDKRDQAWTPSDQLAEVSEDRLGELVAGAVEYLQRSRAGDK